MHFDEFDDLLRKMGLIGPILSIPLDIKQTAFDAFAQCDPIQISRNCQIRDTCTNHYGIWKHSVLHCDNNQISQWCFPVDREPLNKRIVFSFAIFAGWVSTILYVCSPHWLWQFECIRSQIGVGEINEINVNGPWQYSEGRCHFHHYKENDFT